MPKIYEYNEKEMYYTSEPRTIGMAEKQWINNVKLDILKNTDKEHNVVINITWFHGSIKDLAKLISFLVSISENPEEVKIWFTGSVDGMDWFINFSLVPFLKANRYSVSFVGFSEEHWHSWMPAWFFEYNKNLTLDDLKLNENFKYKFLSYNRKPREHRVKLVRDIIDNNLLYHGWITFEKNYFPIIDTLSSDTDYDLHTNDVRWSRPENLTSLGNLNIWQNSFAVIISETEIFDAFQLSEKTWKPIFGLRPFLLNCNVGVNPLLKKLGFYTPDILFNNQSLNGDERTVIEMLIQLSTMSIQSLYNLYQDMLPMLIHNRNRFIEMATMDQTKILNWAQAKSL